MKVAEYLSKQPSHMEVTFIKARARKDSGSPFYHAEYQTTPLRYVGEWKDSKMNEYIILNDKQPSITWLSGADWNLDIKRGYAKCLLVIHPKDFELLYPSKEQRDNMEAFIEKRLD